MVVGRENLVILTTLPLWERRSSWLLNETSISRRKKDHQGKQEHYNSIKWYISGDIGCCFLACYRFRHYNSIVSLLTSDYFSMPPHFFHLQFRSPIEWGTPVDDVAPDEHLRRNNHCKLLEGEFNFWPSLLKQSIPTISLLFYLSKFRAVVALSKTGRIFNFPSPYRTSLIETRRRPIEPRSIRVAGRGRRDVASCEMWFVK